MSVSRHLAFDLGAESGRAVLGTLQDEKLVIRETHRFPNGAIRVLGHLHWNLFGLFEHVKEGMRGCLREGGAPDTVGVDTWGVDFGLLARDGSVLGLPFAYRDRRTEGAMESFFRKISRDRVYELTGAQFLALNSLYQLESMVRDRSPLLDAAADLLFMPDLFHYLLTGVKKTEFTFATTSQLFHPAAMGWADELIAALPIPRDWMQEIVMPATVLGGLSPEIREETGFARTPVVAVATHDTASAVAAVPAEGGDWAYISSGTWSLMGVESASPVLSEKARRFNFTNEGGVGGTWRVLKNIAGLWPVQQCRRAWSPDGRLSYGEMTALAENAPPFAALVDPDSPEFQNPPDMPRAVLDSFRRTGQREPASRGAIVRSLLEGVALKYRFVLQQLREIYPRPIRRIHIVGGGSQNRLLCRFTADATGLPVIAGPVEATAIGNLLVQAMAGAGVESLAHLRTVVRNSFPLEIYEPGERAPWDEAWARFLLLAPI